jgi:hypothetical protein
MRFFFIAVEENYEYALRAKSEAFDIGAWPLFLFNAVRAFVIRRPG